MEANVSVFRSHRQVQVLGSHLVGCDMLSAALVLAPGDLSVAQLRGQLFNSKTFYDSSVRRDALSCIPQAREPTRQKACHSQQGDYPTLI
jgi:hypothetical protein